MAMAALAWGLLICLTVQHIDCEGNLENVAQGKACRMTSMHSTYHYAGNAVNGDTGPDFYPSNCIHTSIGEYTSYWEVDLGRPYPVYSITVWAREGYVRRMAYIAITVDRQPCYQFPSYTNGLPRKIDINCTAGPVNGSVVRVSKDARGTWLNSGDETINVCEFQVWSCSARFWGSGCDRVCGECRDGAACDKVTGRCDSGCKNPGLQPPLCNQECIGEKYGPDCILNCSSNCDDVCNKVTGHCTCKPGWNPPDCRDKCEAGRYGLSCEECGACNGGVPCHHVNGSCEECKNNYKMPLCKDCLPGYYGPHCDLNCSENCEGDVCDRITGHCTCKPGWWPPQCNEECPRGLYGPNCSEVCGRCVNMDDCRHDTGLCTGGCQDGYIENMCAEFERNIAVTITLGVLVAVFGVAVIVLCVVVVIQCRSGT